MKTRRPDDDSSDDFVSLFEGMATPQALIPGDTVQAVIVSISSDTAFLDLGGKTRRNYLCSWRPPLLFALHTKNKKEYADATLDVEC